MIKKIINSVIQLIRILLLDSKKAKVHILNSTDLLEECAQTRTEMQNVHSKKLINRIFNKSVWYRWSYVLNKIEINDSFLDVGMGHGYFLNSVGRRFSKKKIYGFDLAKHGLFFKASPFTWFIGDGQKIPFPDHSFDCVTCLEVIEHLESPLMNNVLSEIRRVARNQIIITVPYDELTPTYKGHKQKFTLVRLESLFPCANFTILIKSTLLSKFHWIMIEEKAS